MRQFGLVSCAMLYTLATFLMLGKQPGLGKEACLLIVISGFVFVVVDMCIGSLKKGIWMDKYARYPKLLRVLIVIASIAFVFGELVVLGYGSPFMISMTMLNKTPTLLLAGCLLGCGVYMATLKEERFVSLTALLGWLFLLGFVFLVIIGVQMASHTVLPFASLSYRLLNQGIWYFVFQIFIHIAVLNALSEATERKFIHIGVLSASLLYGLVFFGNMYLLDFRLVDSFRFPTITSAALMSYGHFLQRLELIAVLGVLLCDVVKIAVLLRFIYRLTRIFLCQAWTRGLLVFCGILVIAVGAFWFGSYDDWMAVQGTLGLIFGSGCVILWMSA